MTTRDTAAQIQTSVSLNSRPQLCAQRATLGQLQEMQELRKAPQQTKIRIIARCARVLFAWRLCGIYRCEYFDTLPFSRVRLDIALPGFFDWERSRLACLGDRD